MALEQIEQRVNDIYNLLAVGIGQSSLTQRVEKIESALYSGSGSGIVISSASIAEVLSSTNFVTGVSGWRITKSGDVEFQSGVFRGDITATSGFFSGTVYVGATSNRIIIDGPNKLLRSENYVAGTSGWQIEGDGDAEFQDGIFRGAITAESGSFVGNVTVGTGGSFSSGQTAYNTGTGFWLEANAGTPRFSLGIPGSAGLTWNGSTLTVNGAFTATSGNITGTLYVGASAPRIIIDGSTKVIKSENYSAGGKLIRMAWPSFKTSWFAAACNPRCFPTMKYPPLADKAMWFSGRGRLKQMSQPAALLVLTLQTRTVGMYSFLL